MAAKRKKPLSKEEFLSTKEGQNLVSQEQQAQKQMNDMNNNYIWELSEHGRKGPIGENEIKKASEVMKKYHDGKKSLENRIIANEEYWKQKHWEQIRNKKSGDPEPTTAWLFNSIANKHAAAMDNYPEPNVLAREEGDKHDAKMLSDIIPVVLEQADFEQVYNDVWWYKLIKGTGIYGVFWDKSLDNGLGNINIKKMDILNLFWEPGIQDIQKSRNFFSVNLVDKDILEQQYDFLQGKLSSGTLDISNYLYDDTVDTTDKTIVVDWYYKKFKNGNQVVHYCKYVEGHVLYATENDPNLADTGLYNHGKYPFVFDVLFPEEGVPAGFGYVDVIKDTQMYIDKLNQVILKNALMASRPRYFASDNADINIEEFADWEKDFVHVSGSHLDDTKIKQIVVNPLDSVYLNILQNKIEELKETSGNRDFSQGGTTSGVTAASAIAALQEAGGKLDRDSIKSAYRSFTEICYICVELIRQFYDEPRKFRIVGERGAEEYITYSNQNIKPQMQGNLAGINLGSRMPVFDIKITAARKSTFSRISQNELAKEMYGMGFFNPEVSDQVLCCLDMMDFEGKDIMVRKIEQNGTLMKTVQELQGMCSKLAAIVDMQNGTSILSGFAETLGIQTKQPSKDTQQNGNGIDSLGMTVKTTEENTTVDKAKEKAMNVNTPK